MKVGAILLAIYFSLLNALHTFYCDLHMSNAGLRIFQVDTFIFFYLAVIIFYILVTYVLDNVLTCSK